jgi:DNA-directed RNA polymerase sigma subunit (sigma70/sigma32)
MFILGFLYAKIVDKIKEHFKGKKLLKDMIVQFEEILTNIKRGQAVFVSRVNHTVMIDTKLKDYNIVNVVYLMDKSIVCIFKENKCIYTSETLDKKLSESIIENIHEQYGKQIDDVVEVLGVTISREELESKLKDFESINPELDLNNLNNLTKKESTEIERIVEENEERFDVDSILDKISRFGMEKITQEELDFLKNQSNK